MEIKLVGLNVVAPVPVPPNTNFLQEKPNLVIRRLGRAGSRGWFHCRGGFGLERCRGQVRKGGEKVTTEPHKGKNVTTESLNLITGRILRFQKLIIKIQK